MENLYVVQLENDLIDYITNLLENHELNFTQEEMENAQDNELVEEIQEILDSGANWFVSWGMGVEILTLENARGLLEND